MGFNKPFIFYLFLPLPLLIPQEFQVLLFPIANKEVFPLACNQVGTCQHGLLQW